MRSVGLAKVPSVLGGNRPQVRDAGRDVFDKVKFLRGEVKKAMEKLHSLELQLEDAEQEREDMRADCGRCDNCSACIG